MNIFKDRELNFKFEEFEKKVIIRTVKRRNADIRNIDVQENLLTWGIKTSNFNLTD